MLGTKSRQQKKIEKSEIFSSDFPDFNLSEDEYISDDQQMKEGYFD